MYANALVRNQEIGFLCQKVFAKLPSTRAVAIYNP